MTRHRGLLRRPLYLLLCLLAGSAAVRATAPETADGPLLKDMQGKVVLLDFWASWCEPCRKSFPWMNELQARYAPQGFVVLAVDVDRNRALADGFLAQVPARFRIEFDPQGRLAGQWDVQSMPSSFLIDRQGRVRQRHRGFHDDQRGERERQIAELLKEST